MVAPDDGHSCSALVKVVAGWEDRVRGGDGFWTAAWTLTTVYQEDEDKENSGAESEEDVA